MGMRKDKDMPQDPQWFTTPDGMRELAERSKKKLEQKKRERMARQYFAVALFLFAVYILICTVLTVLLKAGLQ